MFKRSLSIVLCVLMILTLFPVSAAAGDVQQNLPVNDGMESADQVNQSVYANTGLTGKATLTQDRVSGKYAVKVQVGDVPNQSYVSYTLTNSVSFAVYNYSQINLWVKPGAGAKWIKFLTGSGVLIKNDKNADGIFKVGEDLVSGKWNQVTLDLTKTSSPGLTEAANLLVQTNEFSTWTYDEITSVYAPAYSVDISQMVNGQTQLVNGELQFKPNSGGSYLPNTYNTSPTVLASNSAPPATFSRASVAYKQDGMLVASGVPRYEKGYFHNLLTDNQASVETDITGFTTAAVWLINTGATISKSNEQKWTGDYSLKCVTPGTLQLEGFETTGISTSESTTYMVSVYVWASADATLKLRARDYTNAGVAQDTVFTGTGAWQRITRTITTGVNPVTDLRLAVCTSDTVTATATTFYVDGLQIERGSTAKTWILPSQGKGIWIEEGTTNLLAANQSSVETDTTGFTGNCGTETLTKDTTTYYSGSASLKVVTPGTAIWEGFTTVKVAGSAATVYSARVRIKGTSGTVRFALRAFNAGGASLNQKQIDFILDGTWQDVKVENFTTPATTTQLDIFVLTNAVQAITFYYDCGQIEQKANATSWQIGGTARSTDSLSYTLPKALPSEFFASGWFKPNWAYNTNYSGYGRFILYFSKDTANLFTVYYQPSDDTFVIDNKISGNITKLTSTAQSFSVNDSMFIAFAVLNQNHGELSAGMHLWIGKNGENLNHYSSTYTSLAADMTGITIGASPFGLGYEADGSIDAVQVVDINTLESAGTTFNSTFVNNQYTETSLPTSGPAHLLLCNYDDTVDSLAGNYFNDATALPSGKISRISIDSSYANTSGPVSALPSQKVQLSGVQPAKLALSGDGKRLYYAYPNDGNKLWLLDLNTGEYRNIPPGYVPTEIKVNYDGTKAAFKDAANTLYYYNGSTTTTIASSVSDFEIQNDGLLCYYKTDNSTIYYPSGTVCLSGQAVTYLDIARAVNQIVYSNANNVSSLTSTPAGWKTKLLTTPSKNIDGLWTNNDGTLVFFKTADGCFLYQVSTKTLRKLDLSAAAAVIKVTDDNKLVIRDENDKYQCYDSNTDTLKDIRPSDAASNYAFDVDSAGNKIAYVATGGLSTYYFNAVQRPERYLFSFDGKNSWVTYKDGAWTVVKTYAVPVKEDFDEYGMTIDEVNALDEGDFAALYADGREILHFDVAIYFASVDPYITPCLKGIKVILNGGDGEFGEQPLEKALYTAKEQQFDGANWLKIRKIYPVEIFPREAEAYYFIVKDSVYNSFKNGVLSPLGNQQLLAGAANVEANWIEITQQGLTAEELRAVSEGSLGSLLPGFTIVYALKVRDLSSEEYASLITVDYTESQFADKGATVSLKVNLTNGTSTIYELTKDKAEEFMLWVSERQSNRGPIFYRLKTATQDDYLNYYMIVSVNVL